MPPMYLNDVDTETTLGMIVEAVDGWLDSPSARDRTTQLPTRVGAIVLAPDSETAPRSISVRGVIQGTSLANVRTRIEQLKDLLFRGTVELRFADHPDRVIYARCQEKHLLVTPPQFTYPKSKFGISFLCPDPLIYAVSPTLVAFGTAFRAACPLGTAPSAPVIRLMGPATNPVISYRDQAGTVRGSMTFGALSLLSTDYIELDCEFCSASKHTSGVKSNILSSLSAGGFLLLDPHHADYANAVWPTIEASSGTGEVAYRKAWT